MPLPALTPAGFLPLGWHSASLEEVHETFVVGAPFEAEREVIFRALDLYAARVWQLFPEAVLWVDGGFVTHKAWAPPADVDVAVLVPHATDAELAADPSLWTLVGVSAAQPSIANIPKIQPMAGLVDGYFVPSYNLIAVNFWRTFWQRARQEDGPDLAFAKGFVEVRKP